MRGESLPGSSVNLAVFVGDLVVKDLVFGLRCLTSMLKLPDHSHSLIHWIWSPLDLFKEPCLHSPWDETQCRLPFSPMPQKSPM